MIKGNKLRLAIDEEDKSGMSLVGSRANREQEPAVMIDERPRLSCKPGSELKYQTT